MNDISQLTNPGSEEIQSMVTLTTDGVDDIIVPTTTAVQVTTSSNKRKCSSFV